MLPSGLTTIAAVVISLAALVAVALVAFGVRSTSESACAVRLVAVSLSAVGSDVAVVLDDCSDDLLVALLSSRFVVAACVAVAYESSVVGS